jgi:hypothetical protein
MPNTSVSLVKVSGVTCEILRLKLEFVGTEFIEECPSFAPWNYLAYISSKTLYLRVRQKLKFSFDFDSALLLGYRQVTALPGVHWGVVTRMEI